MKIILAAGLLSAVSLSAPALVSADDTVAVQSARAPVSVETSENITFVQPMFVYRSEALKTERVLFVNRAAVAATDVAFKVVRDGETRIVNDRGSFAPGVPITRTMQEYENSSYRGAPETWTVLAVRFADGTSWSSQSSPNVAVAK